MAWDKDLSLDVLCERLWDMARFAYMDLDKAANYSAKTWAENPAGFRLPVDPRPLRGGTPRTVKNVVRYQRRGTEGVTWSGGEQTDEVLYIGDDSPMPPLPRRSEPDDEDILYIGDDD